MSTLRLVATALVVASAAAPLAGQDYKLSQTPDSAILGSFTHHLVSPEGGWIVYRASQEGYGFFGLFSVPTDGSQLARRLSPANRVVPLGGTGTDFEETRGFALTPDGSRVVFTAGLTTPAFELFTAPIDGSTPAQRLSAPLVAGGSVGEDLFTEPVFRINADGSQVVYMADQDTDEVIELYRVPSDGSAPAQRIHPPLAAGESVIAFTLSPDGATAVYTAGASATGGNDLRLYAAPLDGSTPPRRLSQPIVAPPGVITFELSADGSTVVYRASTLGDFRYELFAVPLDGSATPRKLHGPLLSPTGVASFLLSPDGAYALYFTAGSLFVMPTDGSRSARKIAGPQAFDLGFSPDAKWLVYRIWNGVSGFDLCSARLDGVVPPRRLHRKLAPGQEIGPNFGITYLITPDSQRVVFPADFAVNGRFELHSVAIDGVSGEHGPVGSGKTRAVERGRLLSQPFPSGSGVFPDFAIDAASGQLCYLAYPAAGAPLALFRVPLNGRSEPVELSGPLVAQGARTLELGQDGAAYFASNQDNPYAVFKTELYRVPIDGSTTAVRVTPPLFESGPAGDVYDHQLSADGTLAVFRGNLATSGGEGQGEVELFSVPADGSSAPLLVHDLPVFHGVESYRIAPDASRITFVEEHSSGGLLERELFSVPSDGSTPPVRLHPPLVSGGRVQSHEISADSARVVYRADQELDEKVELYSAPLDASAPPVKLSGVLPATSDVLVPFALDASATRVAYRAADASGWPQLWSAPLDGSSAPLQLSVPAFAGGEVFSFALTADGTRVVYQADLDQNLRQELFIAALDGSQPQGLVSGSMPSFGSLVSFTLTPDGTRALYRADQLTDGVIELFSVPLDASAAPQRLSPILAAGADVHLLAVSPVSTHVAFALGPFSSPQEIWSAAVDGSTPAQLLAQSPNPLQELVITPDGTRVVCRDLRTLGFSEFSELCSVPLDGSTPPVRLNHALGENGTVREYRLTPDGSRVVYTSALGGIFGNIYVVPSDGSSPAVRLNHSPTGIFGMRHLRMSPDGARVLYVADHELEGVLELFAIELP